MAYEIYRSYTDRNVRTAAKAFPDFGRSADQRELRRRITSMLVDAGADQIACDTLYLEWLWDRSGCPTYFINSPDLLDFLERAKFQIDVSAMAFPNKVFSIVVPTKCHFVSFLFGRLQRETHERDLASWVKWMNGPRVEHVAGANFDSWLCCAVPSQDGGRLKSYVPCEVFDEALMPSWLSKHLAEGTLIMPDETDNARQSRCLTLGARLVAYMNAFPETVSPGLPADMAARDAKNFRVTSSRTVMMHEKLRASPEAHMRSAHFRTLGHARFKRDEQGHARVVFVRSALVGAVADSYTVSSKDDPGSMG